MSRENIICEVFYAALQAWGAVNYHNAVVLCRESTESKRREGEGTEEVKVCNIMTTQAFLQVH